MSADSTATAAAPSAKVDTPAADKQENAVADKETKETNETKEDKEDKEDKEEEVVGEKRKAEEQPATEA